MRIQSALLQAGATVALGVTLGFGLARLSGEPGPAPEIAVAAVSAAPTSAPTTAPAFVTYTVRQGDFLYTIAREFEVSVDALLAANQLADPRRLSVGQTLRIPLGTSPDGSLAYTVRRGDILHTIASRFGVTPEAIQAINALPDPNRLTVGQTIRIPLPKS